jgi:hypothetical protein
MVIFAGLLCFDNGTEVPGGALREYCWFKLTQTPSWQALYAGSW